MSGFYAGLDVSDQSTAVCVIDAAGKVVQEDVVATTPEAIATLLKPYKKMLSKVGQESGTKAAYLQKGLQRKRLPIVCLDARITAAALKVQRNKTDKNDARGIARVLRNGWYTEAYIKSDDAFRTRLLLNFRRTLKRKALAVEGSLRTSIKLFGATMQKKAGVITIKQRNPRYKDDVLDRLSKIMIKARAALLAEVVALDKLVIKMAKADPICKRLMTIPGVGPVTALTFRAAVDDPKRFGNSRAVGAYFGLTPRRHQSGQVDVSGRISKIGDSEMRAVLCEAAQVLLTVSKSKSRLRVWGLRLKKEKGLAKARIAVSRKLAVIMHRMWVTGRDFETEPLSSAGHR